MPPTLPIGARLAMEKIKASSFFPMEFEKKIQSRISCQIWISPHAEIKVPKSSPEIHSLDHKFMYAPPPLTRLRPLIITLSSSRRTIENGIWLYVVRILRLAKERKSDYHECYCSFCWSETKGTTAVLI